MLNKEEKNKFFPSLDFKVWLIVILFGAWILRLWRLGTLALWGDEASFLWIAAKPLKEIFLYTFQAPFEHPFLGFIFYHFWIKLVNPTEFSLRFVGACLTLLSIPLAYQAAKLWLKKSQAFLVGLFFAFAPLASGFREARAYPIVLVLYMASLFLFSKLLLIGYNPIRLGIFVLINFLAFFTHYYALPLIIWELSILYIKTINKREGLVRILLISAILIGAIVTWFLTSKGPSQAISEVLKNPKPKNIVDIERVFLEVLLGGPLIETIPFHIKLIVGLAWFLGITGSFRLKRGWLWLSLIVWAFSFSWAIPWSSINSRYFIYILLPLSILWASKVWSFRAIPSFITLITLGILWFYGWKLHFRLNTPENLYREAIKQVEYMEKAGDALFLYGSPSQIFLFRHYYKGHLSPEFISLERAENLSKRSFILGLAMWGTDPQGRILRALREKAYLGWENWFCDWVYLGLYYPPPAVQEGKGLGQHITKTQIPLQEQRYALHIPLIVNNWHELYDTPVASETEINLEGLTFKLNSVKSIELKHPQAIYYTLCLSEGSAPSTPLFLNVRLYDEDGKLWKSSDYTINYPCTRAAFVIPWGIPPGTYKVLVNFYNAARGETLSPPALAETINVIKTTEADIFPPIYANIMFEHGIKLLGTEKWPTSVIQGQKLPINILWYFKEPISGKLTVLLELKDPSGKVRSQVKGELNADKPPIGLAISLPLEIQGRLPQGIYQLSLKLFDEEGKPLRWKGEIERRFLGVSIGKVLSSGFVYPLGKIEVMALPRSFHKPKPSSLFIASLQNIAELVKYDLDPKGTIRPDRTLKLTLYWYAIGEPEVPYTVFTHLVGPDSKIWGQKDNQPVNNTRPTTTWLKGEFITDEYLIPINLQAPPGRYVIYVGMYDPVTGQRVPAYDQSGNRYPNDAIPIAVINVE